jgi:hypothetical protein
MQYGNFRVVFRRPYDQLRLLLVEVDGVEQRRTNNPQQVVAVRETDEVFPSNASFGTAVVPDRRDFNLTQKFFGFRPVHLVQPNTNQLKRKKQYAPYVTEYRARDRDQDRTH